MGRADRLRIASAQLTGVAAAYAHLRRLDHAQALAEARETLTGLPVADRQQVLDEAAAAYALPGQSDVWYPAALQLLVDAGADEQAARAIRARRDQGGTMMRR